MKIAIEPFLLDNALMNYCVFALAAVLLGVRVRILRTVLASLIGAVYALVSLFVCPILREPYLKLPCFLLFALPLYRKAGRRILIVPYILLSAVTVGGAALLLTLLLGGRLSADGTLIGTVPIRAGLASAVTASVLPRAVRTLLLSRRKRALTTVIRVRLQTHTYRLNALIDSGNLLTEPLSGLPVLLIDRAVDAPRLPIPYAKMSGEGVLYGERAKDVELPAYGGLSVDCVCACAPSPIAGAQAILPERVLPHDWRRTHAEPFFTFLDAPAFAASRWQTRWLLVHSHKRRTARTARSGGGGKMHRACADRPDREGQTDRAQPSPRRLSGKEV